ncbi:MAG TPA: hypothetical protein VJ869_12650 [Sphaerochaeta sp.]|nr:hypothetical protein [Sphaerochaeta sp.]
MGKVFQVFRLRRLQLEQSLFKFPYSIHYDTKLLRLRTFAHDIVEYTPGNHDERKACVTTYTVTDDLLVEHEVDQETGNISSTAVTVPLSNLSLICTQDTPVISVHIPEGEPLTPSFVDDSFSLARSMFSPALFVWASWQLDPELVKVLPSGSNFMQRFLKFSVAFSKPQIHERVFGYGVTKADILSWECTTTPQIH